MGPSQRASRTGRRIGFLSFGGAVAVSPFLVSQCLFGSVEPTGLVIPLVPLLFLAAPFLAGYALYRVLKAPKGHDLAIAFAIVGLLTGITLAALAIAWIWTDVVKA